MKPYVDGFVIPVPQDKLAEYRLLSEKAGRVWMEHGALEYRETVLEDAGSAEMVSFPQLAQAREGETVVFAWICYRSRAHRDEVNAKVMADPRIKESENEEMPFDCKRMAFGGFEALVTF
ncbi:DUF1428 domain-containing protein [Roseibacillus ishigakijimensis]|uniref:DUF1428 domain-containing protein n=1 Tax=Roseibacillus ishigakijimensis TaxID=454146 RepID=A0A934RR71_9BACT|nr:DUF1428 domain-containing protein [Roseibacillus ishigakijimensis]MBK1833559.1 DUF1428 domain-containing protein [Roseibacillus ishigakijimensis]